MSLLVNRLLQNCVALSVTYFVICPGAFSADMTAEQYYQRGNSESASGQYQSAINDYNAAIQKDPQCWKAYANRSASRFNVNDIQGALEDIKTATAHMPPQKSLTDLKARIESRIANNNAPTQDLEARRRLARQMLLNAQLGIGTDMSDPAYQIMRLANTVRARGGVIPRDLVKPIPNDLIHPMTGSLINSSSTSTASGTPNSAASNIPDNGGANSTTARLAAIATSLHTPPAATTSTSATVQQAAAQSTATGASDSNSLSSLLASETSKLGSASSAAGDSHMTAQEYFDRACGKGKAMDLAGAIKDYDECIRLNPNHGPAYANRGSARFNMGDHKGGLEDFNKAVSLMPDNPGVKELRDKINQAMAQLNEAH